MMETRQKPVVLAVDDTPENLDVVKGILASDYTVKALSLIHISEPTRLNSTSRMPSSA